MITQFVVPPELQQFLSGMPSRALTNVVWDITFTDDAPVLPTNPRTERRSLIFDKISDTGAATPTVEYNAYISSLDGSNEEQVTFARGV